MLLKMWELRDQFLVRDEKTANGKTCFSVTYVRMHVHKCIRASILRGNIVLRGLYPLCPALPGAHKQLYVIFRIILFVCFSQLIYWSFTTEPNVFVALDP